MAYYQTKTRKLSGTTFSEVLRKAKIYYRLITAHTKRTPYVRSKYYRKQKIFLTVFWQHLHGKMLWRDKIRRIKYFPCAIELLEKTHVPPSTKQDPNRPNELLHRFLGLTPNQEFFVVQVKEDKQTGRKYLISVFPK